MINLIKVVKTDEGKVNFYAVDTVADRDGLQDETIGAMVFVIEDGQYYKRTSSGGWFKIYTGNERVPSMNSGSIIINVDEEMTFGMPIAVLDPDKNDIFCRLDRYDPSGHRVVLKDVPVGKYESLKLMVLKDDRKFMGKILTPFEVTKDEVLEFDMILEPEFAPTYVGEIEVKVSKEESPTFFRMINDDNLKDTAVVASFNPPIEASCRIRNDGEFKTIVIDNVPLQEFQSLKIMAYRNDTKFKGFYKKPFKVEKNIITKLDMIIESETTPVPEKCGIATILVDKDVTGGNIDVTFNPPIKNAVFTICRDEITVENIPNGKYESLKVLVTNKNNKYSGFYKQPFEINSNDINLSINLEEEAIPVPPKDGGMVTLNVDQDIAGGVAEVSFNPPLEGLICTVRKNDIVIENVPNGIYKSIKVAALKNGQKFTGFYKDPFEVKNASIELPVSLEGEMIPVPPAASGMVTLKVDQDISRGAVEVFFNPPIENYITNIRSGDIVIENVPSGMYKSIKVTAIKDGNKYSGFYKEPFEIKTENIELPVSLEAEVIPAPPLEGGMVTIKVNKDITGGIADVTFNPPIEGDIVTVRKGDIVVENIPNGQYRTTKIVALKGDKKYTGFYKKIFNIKNNSLEIAVNLEEEIISMPPLEGGMITIDVDKDMTGSAVIVTTNPPVDGLSCTINKSSVTVENIPSGSYKSIKLLGLKENKRYTGFYTEKPLEIRNINVKINMPIKEEILPTPPKDGGMVTINVDKNMVGGIVSATFNPIISGAICTINSDKITIENVPSGTYQSVKLFGLNGNKKYSGFCKDSFEVKNNNILLDMKLDEELIPNPPLNGGMLTVQVSEDLRGGLTAYTFNPPITGSICTVNQNNLTIENVPNGTYKSFKLIVSKDDKRYTGFHNVNFTINNSNTTISLPLEKEIIHVPEPNTTGTAIVDVGQNITGSVVAGIFDPPVNGVVFTAKKNEVIIENIPNGSYNSLDLFVFQGDKQYTGSNGSPFRINNNEIKFSVVLEEGVGPGPAPGPVVKEYEFNQYIPELAAFGNHKGYEFDNRLKIASSKKCMIKESISIYDPDSQNDNVGCLEIDSNMRVFMPFLIFNSTNSMHIEIGFSSANGKDVNAEISFGESSTTTSSKSGLSKLDVDVKDGEGPVKFDFTGKVRLWYIRITEYGNGSGLIRVDSSDEKPGYLIDKLVGADGSGITFSVDNAKKTMVANFNQRNHEGRVLETMSITSALVNTDFAFGTGFMAGTVLFPDKIMTIKKDITTVQFCNMDGTLDNFRVSVYKYNKATDNLELVCYTYKGVIIGETKAELKIEYVEPKFARMTPDEIYYIFIHKTQMDNNWGHLLGISGWGTPVLSDGNLRLTLKDTSEVSDQETQGENPSKIIRGIRFKQNNTYAVYIYFRLENPE